jgi:hypothetical protein
MSVFVGEKESLEMNYRTTEYHKKSYLDFLIEETTEYHKKPYLDFLIEETTPISGFSIKDLICFNLLRLMK